MAFRRPLYWDGSGLREMTDSMINEIRSRVSYQYSLNPSVTLSVVGSGGNLGTISDTRRTAGAFRSFTTRFPSESETAEPGTVTVNYSRINAGYPSAPAPSDTNNKAWPVFYNGGDIQAMSTTDMYDTFIYPAINTLVSGSTGTAQGGTYRIHTGTSLSGHTLISGTPVFSDTRANTGAYSSGGIPEALDQPFTVTNYYLFRINGSAPSYTAPMFITGSNDVQQYTTSAFDSILQDMVRHVAREVSGHRIRYSLNGSGSNRGSGMSNTVLNGSGAYRTRFVNANDYRAQEHPNGSAVTAGTTFLRIYKV